MEVIYVEDVSYPVAATAETAFATIGLQGTYSGTISYTSAGGAAYSVSYTRDGNTLSFSNTSTDIATKDFDKSETHN